MNGLDSQAALALTRTMDQVRGQTVADDRFTVILFAGFGAVALLLAAVGVYGLTAFSVAQRSPEIALRMALGATRNRVVTLFVKEGLSLACIGLVAGLTGAYFVGRTMQSVLFAVPQPIYRLSLPRELGFFFQRCLPAITLRSGGHDRNHACPEKRVGPFTP